MDYETKKSIPRHLRGAGKRRYRCKHCVGWHASISQIRLCKKNPNRDIELAKPDLNENLRGGGKALHSDPERSARIKAMLVSYNTDPKYAKSRSKSRKKGGEALARWNRDNPRPMPMSTRIGLMAGLAEYRRRNAPHVLERQAEKNGLIAPVVYQEHDFFRPKIAEKTADYWVSVSDDDSFGDF